MESCRLGLKRNWSPLQHRIWKKLRSQILGADFQEQKFLLCVSGGADSVALFRVFRDFPLTLEVFHAHHGPGDNQSFRDKSEEFVRNLCLDWGVPFHLHKSDASLRSENEMREFRLKFLKKWKEEQSRGYVVLGHHSQDLLETRVMRLIRGVGPEGLRSMAFERNQVLRPFLSEQPDHLRFYLNQQKQVWLEDPSNQETRFFRNWLRQKWLPQLEKRNKGSLFRLSQSLENLSIEKDSRVQLIKSDSQGISIELTHYRSLDDRSQIRILAQMLKALKIKEFTLGQLQEIQKRLDNPQKRLTFKVAQAQWSINAQQIFARP